MLGSKILYNVLIKNGVKVVFGYPGGAILPVLNEFYNQNKIKYIMSRTELGGSFMAEGYAKSTKFPGVIMTTSGPGCTNIITSLQNALSDGTPIMALSGQVSSAVLGTNAFQEADVINITKPCTKWNSQILNGNLIEQTINIGFFNMYNNRPGPVLIDLPKNIMSTKYEFQDQLNIKKNENDSLNIKKYENDSLNIKKNIEIDQIYDLISKSKRPIILAGQGVLQSNSQNLLRKFSSFYNIPVTTTLLGLGIVNERDYLSLKMLGMHGSFYANKAIQNSDLLINFGSRFDDRITGNTKKFASLAKIIHIDIDYSNIGKTIKPDYYIRNDCKNVLNFLLQKRKINHIKFQIWQQQINEWKKIKFSFPNKDILQGRYFISILNNIIQADYFNNYTIVADVGAHQMWAAQFIDYDYPRIKFITSGGLGSMGYALPASIGVKIGSPRDIVICICGDGGFTMSMTEILTAVDNKINIKVLVMNNSSQRMVEMWQEKFYDSRIIGTKMKNPSFEKVAESLGCKGILINNKNNIQKKIYEILDYEEGPIVVNIITDEKESVLPMVCPGAALDEMIIDENNDKLEGDAPC